MDLTAITPLILTWNEAPNLARCLAGLTWAQRVLVLDSDSTDATAKIARGFSNVDLVVRPFDDHTTQWNFGIAQATTPWVLSLDADYVLSNDFEACLRTLEPADDQSAFYAGFRYCIFGEPLRSTLYPPRAVLFRADRCRYEKDGHTQLLAIQGGSGKLRALINHDDRKPLSRWLSSQDKYARLEAEKLLNLPADASLSLQDRLRRWIVPAPFVALVYCLFAKGLVLEGWRGWYYTCQRVLAEMILSLHLIEAKLQSVARKEDS